MSADKLVLALSKGRILEQSLPLLARVGIEPLEDLGTSRKLVIETSRPDVRLLVLRAQDVPTFVEHGAADLGVAGKDVLVEHEGVGLYEPLDLRIARCRLVLACPVGTPEQLPGFGRRARVATKYVNATRRYFAERGQQVDTIKLYGSMEIAPAMGLADWIVDLVETGSTLVANGLEARDEVMQISSRLVVNKAAMKMKHAAVQAFIESMRATVESG